jgi:pyrroloquinoline quinone biosynthesis protein B
MNVHLLGTAAGGGFPQWNCACPLCSLARAGDPRVQPRTQDSVLIEAEGLPVLLNCSPDVHRQIAATPRLHPSPPRLSPIRHIVLTDGDLDHVLGLFTLRESHPLVVHCTDRVREGLEANAMLATLRRTPEQLVFESLPLDRDVLIEGVTVRAVSVTSKVPIHLAARFAPSPQDVVALFLGQGPRTVAYAPAIPVLDDALIARLGAADVVLFDGTFWSLEELPGATRMGHVAVAESHQRLAGLPGRKIYVHINNTNPMLRSDSRERAAVEGAGFTVGLDGMQIVA